MNRNNRWGIAFRVQAYKPAHELIEGDEVFAKGQRGRIKRTYTHQGHRVLETDVFGLIYSDEVIVKYPHP